MKVMTNWDRIGEFISAPMFFLSFSHIMLIHQVDSSEPVTKVPLADWIPRQGKDSHDALTKLTDEINQKLGRLLAHSTRITAASQPKSSINK